VFLPSAKLLVAFGSPLVPGSVSWVRVLSNEFTYHTCLASPPCMFPSSLTSTFRLDTPALRGATDVVSMDLRQVLRCGSVSMKLHKIDASTPVKTCSPPGGLCLLEEMGVALIPCSITTHYPHRYSIISKN